MSRYEDQYREWVDSLSDKQRAKLKAKGLDKPLDDFKLNTPDSDIAFAKMGEEFDYDQFDEREAYAEIENLVEERAKPTGRSCFRGYLPDYKPTRLRRVPTSTATRSYLRLVWQTSKAERKLPSLRNTALRRRRSRFV